MGSHGGVLIIDDDANIHQSLEQALMPAYPVHHASSGEEGLDAYERVSPDVVLLDLMLPQMSGIAVLRALKRKSSNAPVIMMTAYAEVQTAVQAIKLGAIDYLQKPIAADSLRDEIGRIVTQRIDENAMARAGIVGQSTAMKRVWRMIEAFGPTDIPVLLQGETGTGKGLIAEAIHRTSKRSRAQFVAIDCATIPEQLAESELFGYEDGAFTGAGKKKRGRVAFADRGTLFLDEIGTLSLATQAKLLTLLEQQNFVPLGARCLEPTRVDVRFICATNVSLQRAVDEGSFRADVFHRLNGVTIELPPLRERADDIELLAEHFGAEYARRQGKPALRISPEAVALLRQYAWPGNIRELQRVMSAAIVLANGVLTPDDLPASIRAVDPLPPPSAERSPVADPAALNLRQIKEWAGREAQKRVIQELEKRGRVTRQELARTLGVDPKTLRSRLREIAAEAGEPRRG
jgi:two-component system, NtrC family, response regulator AtoC